VRARGIGQVELDVRVEAVAEPVGQGADARVNVGKLGDEGVARVDGPAEVPDEGLEELLAGVAGRPLDDGPQGSELVVLRPARGADCGSCQPVGFGGSWNAAGPGFALSVHRTPPTAPCPRSRMHGQSWWYCTRFSGTTGVVHVTVPACCNL